MERLKRLRNFALDGMNCSAIGGQRTWKVSGTRGEPSARGGLRVWSTPARTQPLRSVSAFPASRNLADDGVHSLRCQPSQSLKRQGPVEWQRSQSSTLNSVRPSRKAHRCSPDLIWGASDMEDAVWERTTGHFATGCVIRPFSIPSTSPGVTAPKTA